jgi:hypothetical protein
MQMIDVIKRLAELDATNPNVIKENTSVDECGPMGMMSPMSAMEKPSTPATINITAGSGEELSSMLGAIMKLAGVEKVTPDHLGAEHEPVVVTAEPAMAVGPAIGDRDDMRAVLDKMNDMGDEEGDHHEEETDEGKDEYGIPGVDTTPNRPDAHKAFSSTAYSQNPNDGDGDGENGKKRTMAQPTATYEALMAEYKEFVNESQKKRSELNESLGSDEYHVWKVYFADPEKNPPRRIKVYSDEFIEEYENIKQFYAKKGLTVVDVDTDTSIHGEPRVNPEPYEKDKSTTPYSHRTGADTPYK